MKGFRIGLSAYGKAITMLFSANLWLFLLFPLALNILLFLSGYELNDILISYLKSKIFSWASLENADFFMSNYLKLLLTGFISLILKFLFFFIFAYLGGYILLILMSPIFSILSEQTENILTGNKYEFNFKQFIKDIYRGFILAIRNFSIEFLFVIGVLILSLIPLLGWVTTIISPIFLFLVSSYFYGFSFLDYSCERKKLSSKKSVLLIRKYKGVAIANGMIFSFALIIPFCGVILAGFFAIVSVIAATISMEKVFEIEKNLN